jgi:hypothetical protein
MTAYFELRDRLAELYPNEDQWRRVAKDAGADIGNIVFHGTSLGVWSNILNALRTQKSLDGLTNRLRHENPEVVPLALAYSAEAANGEGAFVDMPALRAVAVADIDLRADLIAQSLDFAQTLPPSLLQMALSDELPTLDFVDAALQGTHTRQAKQKLEQFRCEFAEQLAKLSNSLQTAKGELAKTTAKVDRIENTLPPVEPVMHINPDASDELRRLFWKRHEDQMKAYHAAHFAFEAERNSVGSLRARANVLQNESAQLGAAIANLRMQKEVSERGFQKDVVEARDRDFLLAFRQILDRASLAFHTERDAFKSFWTLLGACAILELFQRIISEAATATEAIRCFSSYSKALAPFLDNSLSEIARHSLAGPIMVQHALAANRQTLADLRDRLSALPMAVLDERRRQARELVERPLPPIADIAELETPEELDKAASNLAGMQAVLSVRIAEMQREIGSELPDLRRSVGLAEADMAATLRSVAGVANENAEALRRTHALWTLLTRVYVSAQLPLSLARFCSAVAQEFERRAGVNVDAVLTDATSSGVGVEEVRAFVTEHLLTDYISSAQNLERRLGEAKEHLVAIEKGLGDLDDRPGAVELELRTQLCAVAFFSGVPVVGLIAAIFASHLVARIQPLVTSDKPAYIRLGSFAVAALAWATGLSGLAVIACAVFVKRSGINLADPSLQIAASAMIVGECAAVAISLRNLLKAIAHRRER